MAKPTQQERFWAKVDKSGDCWLWTAFVNPQGYGAFDGSVAHRFAYEWSVGPIPEGTEVDHTCHNDDRDCPGSACIHRRCVNPAHLEAVPHSENARRGRTGKYKRTPKTHCKRGHEFTPENTFVYGNGDRACRACRLAADRWRGSGRLRRRKRDLT